MTFNPVAKLVVSLLRVITILLLTLTIVVFLLFTIPATIPLNLSSTVMQWLILKHLKQPPENITVTGELALVTGPQAGLDLKDITLTVSDTLQLTRLDMRALTFRIRTFALFGGDIDLTLQASDIRYCSPPREDKNREVSSGKKTGWMNTVRLEQVELDNVHFLRHTDCSAEAARTIPASFGFEKLLLHTTDKNQLKIDGGGFIGSLPWQLHTTQSFPVDKLALKGQLGATGISVSGAVQQQPLSVEVDITLDSPQFFELARYAPLPLKDFGPLSASAKITATTDTVAWQLDNVRFAEGQWHSSGQWKAGEMPYFEGRVQTPKFKVGKLQHWLDQSLDVAKMQPGKLTRDILGALKHSRGSLEFRTDTLVEAGLPLPMKNLLLSSEWQDETLTLELTQLIAGNMLSVSGKGTFEGDAFNLSAEGKILIPSLDSLASLNLPKTLSGSPGQIDSDMVITISTVSGQVEKASTDIRGKAMQLILTDEAFPEPLALESFAGHIGKNEPLTVDLTGRLGEQAATATIELPKWTTFGKASPSPFDVAAHLDPLTAKLSGELSVVDGQPAVSASVTLNVKQLPLPTPLRPPFDIAGQIHLDKGFLDIDLSRFKVGQSEGIGTIAINLGSVPATVEADLRIQQLLLSEMGVSLAAKGQQQKQATLVTTQESTPEKVSKLLPLRNLLSKLQGKLSVAIERWQLDDMSGSTQFAATAGKHLLQIRAIDLTGEKGGTTNALFDLDFSHPEQALANFKLNMVNGHYELSREREGKVSGKIYLDLDLSAKLEAGKASFLRSLNGTFGFMTVPDRGEFLLLDIWGGGLLQALAQRIGAMEPSSINCAAGQLVINKGLITSQALILDGTRVRVFTDLAIDLNNGALQGQAEPLAKQPKLLRAWLPLAIGGTLAQPEMSVIHGAGIVTATRLVLAVPALAFDLATAEDIPENGLPVCQAIFQQASSSTPVLIGKPSLRSR